MRFTNLGLSSNYERHCDETGKHFVVAWLWCFFSFFLRTGHVIAGINMDKQCVEIFMVLTIWPRMQKPKPSPSPVPLPSVKCFRAVQLAKDPSGPQTLAATNKCCMLEAVHVLAVLDVSSDDVSHGKIVITQSSCDVLEKMQNDGFVIPKVARKRNNRKWPNKEARKRATAKVKKQILKDGSEPAKQDSECTGKKSVSAKAVGTKLKSSQAVVAASVVANEEMITAEDVRRSSSGRAAIAKAAKIFRKLESLKFEKPAFNSSTNMCEVNGLDHLSWKAFEGKVGKFFEC